jgi:predicted AlkP superfamily phosphohydrolase/phosphomutase
MSDSRLLVIGLDAGDRDLIAEWAASGDLPTFRKLMDTSVWGDVVNPRGLEAGSCWPTFYFGLSPSTTCQFDGGRHFDPEGYGEVGYRPEKSRVDPIWTTLSKAGKTCGVIDAPYSYPTDEINGMKVVDRSGHVPSGSGNYLDFRTFPPELADEINDKFGEDLAGGHSSDFIPVTNLEGARKFRDLYVNRVDNKAALSLHYFKQKPWDFFMTVFTEAHCVGHRCWHLHDVNHPDHNPEFAKELGNPLKDTYVAIDRAVGQLVEAAEGKARVLVYLSHGMGPRVSATKLLDRILVRLENKKVATQTDPLMSIVRSAWRAMPDTIRRPLWGLRDKVSHDGFQPNRQGRRFFEVYANDRTGGIRINLIGRDSHGMVQPGAEYDTLCEQIIADLRDVINDDTGEPLIAEIQRTCEDFPGEALHYLPDILVTWNQNHPIHAASSPKIGRVDLTGLINDVRTGDHRPGGRFFGLGPGWPHVRLNETVNAADFVPTLTGLYPVDLPRTDGHAIAALMDSAD